MLLVSRRVHDWVDSDFLNIKSNHSCKNLNYKPNQTNNDRIFWGSTSVIKFY